MVRYDYEMTKFCWFWEHKTNEHTFFIMLILYTS
jgi:hypothetical protein